jgi:hypothetical protein
MMGWRVLGVGLLSWLLSACGPEAGGPWFPLREGLQQRYGVTVQRGERVTREVWVQTVGAPLRWHDQLIWPRRHSAGVRFWLEDSAQGLRRVAVQADIDEAPIEDTEPLWVLRRPYAVGTEWRNLTVPHVLRRENEYPNDLRLTHQLWMQWRIAAVDDAVDVAAGHFAPCIRVEGEGKLRLYVDPVKGFQDVPITGAEWYCRGQGLVKWWRREPVSSGFFTGGEVRAELL